MKKILVPTDFSPTAEKAFQYALNFAAITGSSIVLLHVYTPVENIFIDTEEKRRIYNIKTEEKLVKVLRRLRKKMAGEITAPPVEILTRRSPITANILSVITDYAIDLVVMGTQGASGLKKIIIGTEAARVAVESEVPVLLVPEKFEWQEPGLMVFASRSPLAEINALEFSISWAQAYKAGLNIIHIYAPAEGENQTNKEMETFYSECEYIRKMFDYPELVFQAISAASVKETMEHLHDIVPYDFMVMVRSGKTFMSRLFTKNLTRDICYVTRYPLLIIPGDYINNNEFLSEKKEAILL